MERTVNAMFTSEHFGLHRLADGVYAAIGIPGTASYSNTGIIDMGDRALVFDAFMTPKAAQDLRAAAQDLTGKPASYISTGLIREMMPQMAK